jgi:hypothetical protein
VLVTPAGGGVAPADVVVARGRVDVVASWFCGAWSSGNCDQSDCRPAR